MIWDDLQHDGTIVYSVIVVKKKFHWNNKDAYLRILPTNMVHSVASPRGRSWGQRWGGQGNGSPQQVLLKLHSAIRLSSRKCV